METKELKEYLRDIYYLERQLYSYECLIAEYNRNLKRRKTLKADNSLDGIYEKYSRQLINEYTGKRIELPRTYKIYIDNKIAQEKFSSPKYRLGDFIEKIGQFIVILSVIATILISVYTFFTSSGGLGNAIGVGLFFGLFIVGVAVGINFLLGCLAESLHKNNDGNISDRIIAEELQKANEDNLNVMVKLTRERDEEITPILNKTRKVLKQMYAKDIIHPKYRNFVAISQIYGYLDTGRCSELEGVHGAYNLFEFELSQHTIIDKLDTIISQLDKLNETMGYLAASINFANKQLDSISSSLNRIETNTALTNYNSQCIAHNTKLLSRYS